MSYTDRTLTCVDCSVEFIHSAADQEFYAEKGFVSDPKRCPSCRASRRAMRETGGYDSRDIGGPRGYERGDYRATREYFAVICSSCGNAAQSLNRDDLCERASVEPRTRLHARLARPNSGPQRSWRCTMSNWPSAVHSAPSNRATELLPSDSIVSVTA